MNKIKVLLTDDHQIILDGLKSLLKASDDINVAAEANNGREALRILGILSIDVVLMDIDMPVMNGIETLKEIRRQFSDIFFRIFESFLSPSIPLYNFHSQSLHFHTLSLQRFDL